MATIRPFRGLRYNPEEIADPSRVITQPYDKITPRMQAEYYDRHPLNYVRLIYGREEDRYQESADFFNKWMEEGLIIKDVEPALYPYTQTYRIEGNPAPITRTGFITALKLHPYSDRVVLPHERTLKGPKQDRFKLFSKTHKNYEQVFMLYADSDRRIEKFFEPAMAQKPLMEATDDYDCIHRVWRVSDPEVIGKVQEVLAPKPVMIADGHHRYETALALKEHLVKDHPDVPDASAFNHRMVTLVNLFDPGLLVLPTHRYVIKLKTDFDTAKAEMAEYFEITPVAKEELAVKVKENADKHAFGLYRKDGSWLLLLKDDAVMDEVMPADPPQIKALDVSVLHNLVIEKLLDISKEEIESYIRYERYVDKAFSRVDSGEFEICFLMNPTKVEQVEAVSAAGARMPQKSTDFYPKLVSGLVAFDVSPGEVLPW
ncbi:hypothetical protein CEE36_02855 [candidate division TA06 bacterium B3_TA06]|uniref:DUF1015 domain-containing protein n=1 Tax=candidate division TA06 bacterium B3_TA06 TaxID=2012487 RepID=A0A532V8V8_UNCT6|nr:MAG: hypothetical protein CEE36_02855 [candidate division TA06 bacterium B3_TA06]